jgi:hypothetical protein
MRHGDILARARVPIANTNIESSSDRYLSHHHLGIKRDITIFGRVYRLVDADQFTRHFYNQTLPSAEMIPTDPFHEQQVLSSTASSNHYEPVSAHFEAVHGRPQPWQLERSRQFLNHDGQVNISCKSSSHLHY